MPGPEATKPDICRGKWLFREMAWALTLGLTIYALALFAQVHKDLQLRWSALAALFVLALPLLALTSLVSSNILLAFVAFAVVALLYLGVCLLLRLLSPEPLQLAKDIVGRGR